MDVLVKSVPVLIHAVAKYLEIDMDRLNIANNNGQWEEGGRGDRVLDFGRRWGEGVRAKYTLLL